MNPRLWHRQLLRFGIVGMGALIVYLLTGFLLLNGIGMELMTANIGAFFVSMIFSYLGHTLWSFEARDENSSRIKFFVLSVIALTTTMLISYAITENGIPSYWGILVTAVVIPSINFPMQKLWVFKK